MAEKISFSIQEKNKPIAFFDRDGVINIRPPEHQHVTDWSKFKFNKKIFEVMLELKPIFQFVVITNQQGISKGEMTKNDLNNISIKMAKEFELEGIEISAIYYCPHLAESNCDCRKPKPGLITAALADFDTKPDCCILIGDSQSDISAGEAAGIHLNYLIPTNKIELLNSKKIINEFRG